MKKDLSPRRLTCIFSVLITALMGVPAAAQQNAGRIVGVAVNHEDGRPLPFALVRLRQVQQEVAQGEGILTDSAGGFRFARVPPGDYRLHLELIGYQRVVSPVLRVRAGETVRHELRSGFEPIELSGVTARAGGACLTADQLDEDEELRVLWHEARKGIEARRAFELQYRFSQIFEQDVNVRMRLLRNQRELRVDTVINEPDSVLVREQRWHARQRETGYGRRGGLYLALPDEGDLLRDEFLADHCLMTHVAEAEGLIGLRFRPATPRRDRVDIGGTIWLETDGFLIRRLDLAWMEGARTIATGTMTYTDVPAAGGTLRLATSGRLAGRPSGAMRSVVLGATSDVRISYLDFQPVADPR